MVSRQTAIRDFHELSTYAGRCLRDLPNELHGLLAGTGEIPHLEAMHRPPPHPGSELNPDCVEADYWLITIHRMGWLAFLNRPGSLLAIRPELWECRQGLMAMIRGLEDRDPGLVAQTNAMIKGLERDSQDLFVSNLPLEAHRCSVHAIDRILEMDREETSRTSSF